MHAHDLFVFAPMLFPFLMIALVAGLLVLTWQQGKKRRLQSQAFAASRGWTWVDSVPALTSRWRSYPFARGHSLRATNVMAGDFHGRHVVSFEYQFTTGSGKNRSTSHFHVVALSLPTAMPWLQLTPDGAGASIARFFGGQDVQLESKAFNDTWRVQAAPPPQYAYDFLHPRMMERLMAPDAVGARIAVEGTDILIATPGHRNLQSVDHHVNLLFGITELVPRHLWLKLGYDPLVRAS